MRESISLKILARSQNKWGSSCCCVTSRSKGSAALGNVLERPGPSSWSRRLLHQSIYVAAALLLWEDKEVNTRSLPQWQHLGTKTINRQYQEADHPELNWELLSLRAVRVQRREGSVCSEAAQSSGPSLLKLLESRTISSFYFLSIYFLPWWSTCLPPFFLNLPFHRPSTVMYPWYI